MMKGIRFEVEMHYLIEIGKSGRMTVALRLQDKSEREENHDENK